VKINQIRMWDYNKTKYEGYFIIMEEIVVSSKLSYIIIRSLDDGSVLKYTKNTILDLSLIVEWQWNRIEAKFPVGGSILNPIRYGGD